jgi:hypothetical protein
MKSSGWRAKIARLDGRKLPSEPTTTLAEKVRRRTSQQRDFGAPNIGAETQNPGRAGVLQDADEGREDQPFAAS